MTGEEKGGKERERGRGREREGETTTGREVREKLSRVSQRQKGTETRERQKARDEEIPWGEGVVGETHEKMAVTLIGTVRDKGRDWGREREGAAQRW